MIHHFFLHLLLTTTTVTPSSTNKKQHPLLGPKYAAQVPNNVEKRIQINALTEQS
jgi:hypothetical protein